MIIFKKPNTNKQVTSITQRIINKDWSFNRVNNTQDDRVHNEHNRLVYYRKCDNNGILMYNNIFVDRKKIRRDEFDSEGYLSRTQHLDHETGHPRIETYYRRNGDPCIYKYYTFKNDRNSLIEIQLIDKTGEIIEVFPTETAFIAYWLKLILVKDKKHFLIIDKERTYFPALLKLNLSNVLTVCTIHSSHLRKDQDILNGILNSNYRAIFENLQRADALVVLTERQREHIQNRFGRIEGLSVIPHSTTISQPVDFAERSPKTIIYLARYSEEKRHDRLIRVFHRVLEKHPESRLALYGSGKLKNSILKQVKKFRN